MDDIRKLWKGFPGSAAVTFIAMLAPLSLSIMIRRDDKQLGGSSRSSYLVVAR